MQHSPGKNPVRVTNPSICVPTDVSDLRKLVGGLFVGSMVGSPFVFSFLMVGDFSPDNKRWLL